MVIPGRDTKDPTKNPYKTQNTTSPEELLIPIQPKHRIDAMKANGICMLSGPALSAKKFGTNRPKVDAALMMDKRYDARVGLVLVCSSA